MTSYASFLNYCFNALIGGPAVGESWYCLACNPDGVNEPEWASLSVMPPMQHPNGTWYPIKFKSFRCGWWGDEYDLVRRLNPGISKKTCYLVVKELLEEYADLGGGHIYAPFTPSNKRSTLGEVTSGSGKGSDLTRPQLPPLVAQSGERAALGQLRNGLGAYVRAMCNRYRNGQALWLHQDKYRGMTKRQKMNARLKELREQREQREH
jgi:hypothetical protein